MPEFNPQTLTILINELKEDVKEIKKDIKEMNSININYNDKLKNLQFSNETLKEEIKEQELKINEISNDINKLKKVFLVVSGVISAIGAGATHTGGEFLKAIMNFFH